tara:strand:- start:162 stop:518 length:357 start_codon:yes stop_codon:yes gene_type:complete
MPTALSSDRFDNIGTTQAAGKMVSWQTIENRNGFRMCKHSIATMFIDGYSVVEPNSYPSVQTRIAFEEKLEESIRSSISAFTLSYARQGLSLSEIVFSLAQGLNLDDVETAYVVLNTE